MKGIESMIKFGKTPEAVVPAPLDEDLRQYIFCFENGYGASIIPDGLDWMTGKYSDNVWELAVIEISEDKKGERDWELCFDTEITKDVIRHRTEEEIEELLNAIEKLPKKGKKKK